MKTFSILIISIIFLISCQKKTQTNPVDQKALEENARLTIEAAKKDIENKYFQSAKDKVVKFENNFPNSKFKEDAKNLLDQAEKGLKTNDYAKQSKELNKRDLKKEAEAAELRKLDPGPMNDKQAEELIKNYIQNAAHDPDSVEFVSFGRLYKENRTGMANWTMDVAFRAKNGFGAKILGAKEFIFRDGRIIDVKDKN